MSTKAHKETHKHTAGGSRSALAAAAHHVATKFAHVESVAAAFTEFANAIEHPELSEDHED